MACARRFRPSIVLLALASSAYGGVPAGIAGRYSVGEGLLGSARGTILVVDAAGRVEVPGLCRSRRARFTSTGAGVSLHVRWRRCTGSGGPVRVTAAMTNGGFSGRVRVGRRKPRAFGAGPSTCGDGVLDVENGESCDTDISSMCAGGVCTSGCTCFLKHPCGDGVVDVERGEECDIGLGPFCESGAYCESEWRFYSVYTPCTCRPVAEAIDEVEPNDDVATAIPLGTSTQAESILVRGSIDDAADVDYFTFIGVAFAVYVLDGSGTGCEGIDPLLVLSPPYSLDHNDFSGDVLGGGVSSDDDYGTCPLVTVRPVGFSQRIGRRFLAVSSANGIAISAYTLRIEGLHTEP
jgi:hypothetical protein